MAIDTTILNSTDVVHMENAFAAVFAEEGVDCSPGTAVRELAVRPAAVMRAHLDTYQTELVSMLDLSKVASGELEGDDAIVDALASTYRITRRSGTASYGSIMIQLASDATTYIGPSYRFYVGDYALTIGATYVGVVDTSGSVSNVDVQYVPIRHVGSMYYMVVPVACPSGKTFAMGTEVQLTGSVGNILSVTVYSSIMGGSGPETNQSLAHRIMYGVLPGVLSTPLQLQNGFGDSFGIAPHRVAVFGTGSPAQRRDTSAAGGRVDIAVAQAGGCPVTDLSFTATGTDGSYTGLLEDAAGVYAASRLFAGNTEIETFSVTWGAAASDLHTVTAETARYSSLQTATISFSADGLADTLECALTVTRIANIRDMQVWLDSSDRRAPGQDTLVRAPVPCFLSLSVALSGGTLATEVLKDSIITHLNNLPVGRGYVSAQDIADALQGTGVGISYPMRFTGRFVLPDKERVVSSVDGKLNIGVMEGELAQPVEIAFFTDADSVSISRT